MTWKKIVEPRMDTPSPGSGTLITARLPDDFMTEQAHRVALLAAVGGGLWTFGLFLDAVVAPLRFGASRHQIGVAIELIAICVSMVTFVYLKRSHHSAQTKTEVGLGYMVFSSFAIALINSWTMESMVMTLGHLSWITIIILVSSMIMVTTPAKVLVASLVAASMDPLGIWIAHLRGLEVPGVIDTFLLYLPNYTCAVVALLPSSVLRHMGRRLREAREMGSYRLIELLGHGGMGEVWRAQHRLLARSAAIKLIRPEALGAGSADDMKLALRRFEREAQATAALSSPNTIRLFDFGRTGEGHFYYVMELLSGRDLQSLVTEFGPLPPERAVYLLRQVCHSLADAHARGLVHRDVKPANIYVCRMGLDYDFIKVLDFGLVKFRNTDISQTMLSGNHSTTGTPAYMAPEIILGETNVDRRADVYSLGCVAYFLLTGQLVFEGDTPMKVLLQHVQTEPIPPSQRVEVPIPRELDELVMACLQKDPNKRPQDAEHLYRMTCGCNADQRWSSELARTWWEQNLAELTGPLTLNEPTSDAGHAMTIS